MLFNRSNILIINIFILVVSTGVNAAVVEKHFSYEGRIYFDETHAGLHDEQLSNIKLNTHFNISEQAKFHALFIYNTLPAPNKVPTPNKIAPPATFNLQSGYKFEIKNLPAEVIGFYEHSYQSLVLKLPKQKIGAGLNFSPSRSFNIQLQYFTTYNYAKKNEKMDGTLVAQLVVSC